MGSYERCGLSFLMFIGLSLGCYGIRWGLPGSTRLRAFPKSLIPTPEIARKFTDSWSRLYENIRRSHKELREEPETSIQGIEEIPPGWSFPPKNLLNSYRSLLLQSENPDEKKSFIILSQMRPWRLEFKPLYVQYGGAFIYPLGAFLKMLSLCGVTRLIPDMSHYLLHPDDMGKLYLWGRIFILIFHLGSLWLIYDMGRRILNWEAGFFAALFFCLCPIVVTNTHILKPHPYAAFWCLAALRCSIVALETGAKRDYWLSGLCSGMAAGSNFIFEIFVAAPILAWLIRRINGLTKPKEWAWIVAAAIGSAGLCLLANPYLILAYKDFAWEFKVFPGFSRGLSLQGLGRPGIGAAGATLYTVGVLGMVMSVFKDSKRKLLALFSLSAVATMALFLSRSAWVGSDSLVVWRFFLPFIGIACILGADFLYSLPKPMRMPILALVLLDTALRGWVYSKNMAADSTQRSTRLEAASWIEQNIPAGSSVGLVRYPEPAHTPPFRYDLYRLIVFQKPEALTAKRLPEIIVVDDQGNKAIAAWASSHYRLAKTFDPIHIGWAHLEDDSFFANAGIFIYRREK